MSKATKSRLRGMTLVELLVVVAIIGVLAVTVLPNVAGIAESRRSREAARAVSSFIAKAQSRAVGRREWAGFMIAAVSTSTTSFVATDLYLADVPPVYRGDTVPALLTITGVSLSGTVGMGTTGTAVGSSSQLSLQGSARVQPNDTIRFGGRGPWFEITGVNSGTITFQPRGAGLSGGGREDAGYTSHNTPWPPVTRTIAASAVQLPFEVLRQPVPSGSPVSLADGRVIDVAWCGCGPPTVTSGTVTLSTYRPFITTSAGFSAVGGAVTNVLFDGTGRLRQIVSRVGGLTTTFRQTVTGPVFLLIGRADRANQAFVANPTNDTLGANWQYQDSFWVAIDPASGIAKTAECTPGATTVVASQVWIRRAFLAEER